MAPLSQVLKVHASSSERYIGTNATVYTGNIDKEWTVAAVPNGGYVLGLVIEACTAHQRRSVGPGDSEAHTDPIHVTAHFLRTTADAPFEVHVRTLKNGRGFTNVTGEMVQKGQTTVSAHIIFGVLSSSKAAEPPLTLLPPSPYARRIPLSTHPSGAKVTPMRRPWNFKKHVQWAEDPVIAARTARRACDGDKGERVEGMEWGAWFELTGKDEQISPASLAFFADVYKKLPELLPKEEREGLGVSWFPTMVMTIEFKAPIPAWTARTVGLYSNGKFMHDPQGRHDAYVEVWTAPSGIGEGGEEDGWRGQQRCLAIASQMALTLPVEVNLRQGGKLSKL